MAEEIQAFLERIRTEGVAKAEAEAEAILKAAREKAAAIQDKAKAEADALLKNAEREARDFEDRATRSLRQAARDVVLSIGGAVTATLQRIVAEDVRKAMDAATLQAMLVKFVEAYCATGAAASSIELLVSEGDREAVADYFVSRLGESMREGLEIKGDRSVAAGFKATMVDQHVQHDFTDSAAAEAIGALLRPRLAAIVREAMTETDKVE